MCANSFPGCLIVLRLIPTLKSSRCILHRGTVEVAYHPKLLTRMGLYTSATKDKTESPLLLPRTTSPAYETHRSTMTELEAR